MPTLHDSEYREAIKTRLKAIRADSPRKWGVMTADQMMWHVCEGVEITLGKKPYDVGKTPPLPKFLMRWLILDLPWPKGAPTLPGLKADGQYDLEAERARCLRLVDELAARPIDGHWPVHPLLGNLTGEQYSKLQAKHLNHHLKQFGV